MDLGWPHCFVGHSLLFCSYYHMVRNLLETVYICHQDWWDCGVPSPVEWELPKVGETDSALKFLSFFMSMSHYSIKYLPLSLSPCPSVSFIICPCIYLSFFFNFSFFCSASIDQDTTAIGFMDLLPLFCCPFFIMRWQGELLKKKDRIFLVLQVMNYELWLTLSCPCDLSEIQFPHL